MTEAERIVATYRAYLAEFQTLDAHRIVPYYHLPCLMVSAADAVALQSSAEVEAYFGRTMGWLRKRGYARSEVSELSVTELGEGLALLGMRGVRYKADGTLLQPLGVTYLLRKLDDAWRIAVLTLHDPAVLIGPRD